MVKVLKNQNGAILVFVLLAYTFMVAAGLALLSTTSSDNKMKEINSKAKAASYGAESSLEEAILITANFLDTALSYTKGVTITNPDEAFNKYLMYGVSPQPSLINILKNKSNYIVYKEKPFKIDTCTLTKATKYYQLKIKSTYDENSIKQTSVLICNIDMPDFTNEATILNLKGNSLIHIVEWDAYD